MAFTAILQLVQNVLRSIDHCITSRVKSVSVTKSHQEMK